MITVKNIVKCLVVAAFVVNVGLRVAEVTYAQNIAPTDNPQSLVGGGLQPTGAGLQNTGQVLAADSVYNYDSTNQNIKIELQQAANQPQTSDSAPNKGGFPWRYFWLGAGALVALMIIAKVLDRPSGSIFTKS